MAGKVYIVGVGPGDPKLITLKALECIKKADVLIYDRLVNQKILKYAKADAEFIDVGKMPDFHAVPQAEINNLVIAEACSGKTVVRVKGGDPFVFGRGGEEAEILSDTGIDFEIVPGISSAISVPAYAGIPVTHRDYCSSFHVITGHEKPDKAESWLDYRELAKLSGTLVFLMGIKNLPDICKNLILHGRDENTPVAVIEKGTTSRQRIVTGTLDNIVSKVSEADIQSPAVTVIGDVVRLKDRLHWYPKGPLAGKRIVVTRSREQASELIEQIEALGAEAIEFPTIKVVPPYRWGAFDQVLENISGFHWIVFTSTNGVKGFFNRLKEKGLDIRQLYGVKLCAVGAATQAELVNLGLRIDFVPKTFTTRELLDGLVPQIKTGEKVLLARADIASPVLSDGLKERNIPVEDLVVYHTIPDSSEKANIVNLLTNNQVDFITFTSSSTVQHFVSMIGAGNISLANRCKIVCIGPVTAKTATAFGLTVTAIADQYTIDGLVEKLTRINLI